MSVQSPELAELLSGAASFATKQDYVASLLRDAIVSGRLPPGKRLRQDEVSRQLGLSWTPVREAFRQLEAEGWLVIERHRGAIVPPLTVEDFEDIYLLRLANEPLIARLSTERLDEDALVEMEALDERLRRLDTARESDWLEFLRLEREFHARQYRAAASPRLYDLVMHLRDAADRYLRASLAIPDEPAHHRRTHQDTLLACRARDGAAAEATMRRALERVWAGMRPLLAHSLASPE